MTKQVYLNAFDAIRDGNAKGIHGIAYRENAGWVLYDVSEGVETSTDKPELLCLGNGKMPVALSRMGELLLRELLEEALATVIQERTKRFDQQDRAVAF